MSSFVQRMPNCDLHKGSLEETEIWPKDGCISSQEHDTLNNFTPR